jgi:hypothetical protein
MRRSRIFVGAVGLALAIGTWGIVANPAAASVRTQAHHHGVSNRVSSEQLDQAMRKLWEDHITWTRLFIVSATAGLPDLQATTDRLLQDQVDIGDAIKPYYGATAGTQLTNLLRAHILGAADVLTAAKASDDAKVQQTKDAWYANGHDIAAFLSSANPKNWKSADMDSMMRQHLDLTLDEAVAHLQGRYADDVAAYDRVHNEILQMADMLADGIVHQFPKKFS